MRSRLYSLAVALSVGISALATSTASAQVTTPSPTPNPSPAIPAFARQIAGRNVSITTDADRFRGVVTSLSAGSLVINKNGAPTTIPYDKIVRVERPTHYIRNGTLIGLLSGAVLGLTVLGTDCGDESCYGTDFLLTAGFFGGLGAGAGAGIGAVIRSTKRSQNLLYDARRSTTTVTFAPILSTSRKGMAFKMSWR